MNIVGEYYPPWIKKNYPPIRNKLTVDSKLMFVVEEGHSEVGKAVPHPPGQQLGLDDQGNASSKGWMPNLVPMSQGRVLLLFQKTSLITTLIT